MSQFQYAVKMYLVSGWMVGGWFKVDGFHSIFSSFLCVWFQHHDRVLLKLRYKYQIVIYYLLFTCFQDHNTQLIWMGNSQM